MASSPDSDSSSGSTASEAGATTIFESPLFDSFDGWARMIRQSAEPSSGSNQPESIPAEAPARPGAIEEPGWMTAAEAPPWTPTRRPGLSLLHVVDDGRDSGETVRLRGDTLTVGRTTGGVSISHDPFLEEAHARLDRLPGGGWLLTDLASRDGTWVRATTAKLREGTTFRVGSTTIVLRNGDLVVRGPGGEQVHPVPPVPFLIGRRCGDDRPEPPGFLGIDDPFMSPIHAELTEGRSCPRVVNHGLNGLWVRIGEPVRLDTTAQFQCGDQRFVLERLPSAGGGG